MKLFLNYSNLCEIPQRNAGNIPARISHKFRVAGVFGAKTWADFAGDIKTLSAGFSCFGVEKGLHAAFFADNRYEWALTDYALMSLGAVSVPRGSDTSPKEQRSIFIHSDSVFLIMENLRNLHELAAEFTENEINSIKQVFIMDEDGAPVPAPAGPLNKKIIYYSALFVKGMEKLAQDPGYYDSLMKNIGTDDLAAVIYTSGTSGNPKGVMLSHGNFLHNVRAISPLLQVDPDKAEKTISILPSWHVYERTYEYCSAACCLTTVYSSIKTLADDLLSEKPALVCSVPRVWESIYEKMNARIEKSPIARKLIFKFFLGIAKTRFMAENFRRGYYISFKRSGALPAALNRLLLFFIHPLYLASRAVFRPIRDLMGGQLRASISGGGSLPPRIDLEFNAMGIKLVNAYGMTETSPGSITRNLDRNTIGSIGLPLPEVSIKIVKENGRPASPGERGTIFVRGPNVMSGYYKNPEATSAVLSPDGWLDTGDIGTASLSGDIMMTGRAKSTIVLLGGENLEPEPIEEKLQESALIDHAVVLGQDKKGLVALISVNEEKLKHLAGKMKISWDDLVHKGGDIIMHNKIIAEVNKEIKKLISRANGFRPFEKINRFVLIKKKFSIGDELTQTLKVKRGHVEKKYKHLL